MMTETQTHLDLSKMVGAIEEPRELKNKNEQRKKKEVDMYATGKDWKGTTKQIEMMPIAEVPNLEESFRSRNGIGGCINLDSL